MKRSNLMLVSSLVAVALAACSKKDDASGASAGKPTPGSAAGPAGKPSTAPAAIAPLALPTLGLTLDAPGDATANAGAGDSLLISSATMSDCTIMLGKENPDLADSYEKTLANIKEGKMGNGALEAVSKEEQVEGGGWKIEWTAKGLTGGTVYGVDYRVMIDGTAYGCARKTRSAEGQACVAKACASLRKS
ncbi:MAG: hypothetical protein R2939_03980 [Kofleriaceae bacterium]